MRRLLSKWGYKIRMWLARRWCDPQLAWLAERYGAVVVTADRQGKYVLPIYQTIHDGRYVAELAHQLHRMTEERDYWKRRVDRTGAKHG